MHEIRTYALKSCCNRNLQYIAQICCHCIFDFSQNFSCFWNTFSNVPLHMFYMLTSFDKKRRNNFFSTKIFGKATKHCIQNSPKPPSIIPIDPTLAKPHSAYVTMASVRSLTHCTSPLMICGMVPLSRFVISAASFSYAMNSLRKTLVPINSAA